MLNSSFIRRPLAGSSDRTRDFARAVTCYFRGTDGTTLPNP
ncbi:hypothetical protein ACWGJP_01325 [Microbacterium sp. NPDC055903]